MSVHGETTTKTSNHGFTLVEVIIIVVILGVLGGIVFALVGSEDEDARRATFVSNLKRVTSIFSQYYLDHGKWPADKYPGEIPVGMEDELAHFPWTEETTIGGQWDWDPYGSFNLWMAGVSVKSPDWDAAKMQEIDAAIDDGDLSTGAFRTRPGGYVLIIEY
jgi:prepilin-type N-terminal cleavage/methylation domain-containing protein